MAEACKGCGRSVRCICHHKFPIRPVLGPAEPAPPGWQAQTEAPRAPVRYRAGAAGVLSRPAHAGCLNGCARCGNTRSDPRLVAAIQQLKGTEYNKFSSEH